uniref:GRIP domain-containing protein n=1 Tax=Anopheles braziliensis TaxID=58242 RepID=A0A2M3ZJY1_9DIPT
MVMDGTDGDHSIHGSLFGGGRGPSPTVELQQTKEQLTKQESRVRHLTAVLAEAEQDLAKLTQLNELLKEEVRRQQRSIEREAHVHNSEYLKNVIFKFITLNNGDERSRLVPVLNTILKLSPDETQKLQNVAKGSDTASRGWTGLLWNS